MESNSLISIIMTCHNGEQYVRQAIDSIIRQTYSDWELIFYDNFSTDKSAEIVKKYKDLRIKYYKSEELVNLGTIRKLSFDKCNGSFISFLDVDDYWLESKLEKQIEKFEKNKKIEVLYSSHFEIYKNIINKKKKIFFNGFCQNNIISSYIDGLPLTTWLTLMIKKSAINKLEYSFDNNLHITSDFDLIIRLSNFCNFDFLEDYLAFYRLHDSNESKNRKQEIKELAYIIQKYKEDYKINAIFQRNNFADKVLIKNFIFNKSLKDNVQINSNFFLLLYFIIKLIPVKILNFFFK